MKAPSALELYNRLEVYIKNDESVNLSAKEIGIANSSFRRTIIKCFECGVVRRGKDNKLFIVPGKLISKNNCPPQFIPDDKTWLKVPPQKVTFNPRGVLTKYLHKITPTGDLIEFHQRSFEQMREYHQARLGYAPDYNVNHPVPDGLTLNGLSIKTDADGTETSAWTMLKLSGQEDFELQQIDGEAEIHKTATMYVDGKARVHWASKIKSNEYTKSDVTAAIQAFFTEPLKIPALQSHILNDDIIPWFQIGDAHLGMLAHELETGANFDLKIAEREICTAISLLIAECPPGERCVLNDLGDFTHYENFAGETEAHRHSLDYDTRFPKMIKVYARILRFMIDEMLTKFKFVDVIINRGNHSETNDVWASTLISTVYNTERVNVLDNSSIFIPYRMGNTFVMTCHSHKTKFERIVQVMSQDYRQDWGECEYRYIDIGHLHHKMAMREDAGCVLEMWNTLTPRDQYGSNLGYRSMQSITRVDRSKKYGEVGRRVLPIKLVHEAIKRSKTPDVYLPPARRAVYTV